MMIPSESCILPDLRNNTTEEVFRRTIFTTSLEGSWTGVGHREMVWCHQVRWRVARAALELGSDSSLSHRVAVLDRWLRDGNHPSRPTSATHNVLTLFDPATYEILPADQNLVLERPRGSQMYLLPIPSSPPQSPSKFILYLSQGSVPPVSPQHPISLRASVYICHQSYFDLPAPPGSHAHTLLPSCTNLSPADLKLIPNPIPGTRFPAPDEGSDESHGVVVFEALVQPSDPGDKWVAVHTEDADGAGWVIGGFAPSPDDSGAVTDTMGAMG